MHDSLIFGHLAAGLLCVFPHWKVSLPWDREIGKGLQMEGVNGEDIPCIFWK